jgi:hypothetical protein
MKAKPFLENGMNIGDVVQSAVGSMLWYAIEVMTLSFFSPISKMASLNTIKHEK